MKTVAFVYGWSEGGWQSRIFRSRLKKRGIAEAKAEQADIIIAHSSGCYLVPNENKAKLIVLIGLPYWPKRSLITSGVINTALGLKYHRAGGSVTWWLNKLSHNFWYMLARPSATYYAYAKHSASHLPDGKNKKVLLVRNKNDAFCHPDIQKLLPKTKNYKLVEMPGDHEHCWLHPEKYIELIA